MVDTSQLFMDAIKTALSKFDDIEVVGSFISPSEMMNFLTTNKADLAITDIDLRESDGHAVLQRIHRLYHEMKVMILSFNTDANIILKSVDLHADGIQMKDCQLNELYQSIKIVMSGQKYYAPQVLRIIASRPLGDGHAGLSKREIEIMQLLANGNSAKEIGDRLLISARTVETHKANIMRKLNVKKATQLVKIAYDRGLVKIGGGIQ